jgi:hypothetical protein
MGSLGISSWCRPCCTQTVTKKAQEQGYASVAGFAEYIKHNYDNSIVYVGQNGIITGIGFTHEEDATLFALEVEH